MNRVFISLYLLIVVSIVVLGWGADKLWQAYNPEPKLSASEDVLLVLIDDLMLSDSSFSLQESLSEYPNVDVQFKSLDSLAESNLATLIRAGEVISLFDSQGNKLLYKKVGGADQFVQIEIAAHNKDSSLFYLGFLFVFYLFIALVIYFWIWPLTRDLKYLQSKTKTIDKDGVPEYVDLGASSTVYDLAKSFNSMSERIRNLVLSHKEMTSAVSHELRTPLARMKFALAIAASNEDKANVDTQLKSIKVDVDEMDALINGLLAYAGFEQQSQTLELNKGDLASLIETILKHLGQDVSDVQWEFDNQLGGRAVCCEWHLIERCLHNVIQNGLRYAHSKLLVTARINQSLCEVVIDDDGQGVGEESREKILQPFVRLPGQNKQSGFGLGLAIVKRIITWHKGNVEISQSQMGGARVTLRWPAE